LHSVGALILLTRPRTCSDLSIASSYPSETLITFLQTSSRVLSVFFPCHACRQNTGLYASPQLRLRSRVSSSCSYRSFIIYRVSRPRLSFLLHTKSPEPPHLQHAINIQYPAHPNAASPSTIPPIMPAMTFPRISNASLTSILTTFLIFLFRCHGLSFVFFPCFGEIASLGCTCPAWSLRSQRESSGSWYGSSCGSRYARKEALECAYVR
jgi:hypothetical protein